MVCLWCIEVGKPTMAANKKHEKLDISDVISSVCKHEFILPSDDLTHIKCAECGEPI